MGIFSGVMAGVSAVPAAIINAGIQMSTTLVPFGVTCASLAFLAEVVIFLYSWWMGASKGPAIARFIRLAIICSMVATALTTWSDTGAVIPRLFQSNIAGYFGGDPMTSVNQLLTVVDKFWKDTLALLYQKAKDGSIWDMAMFLWDVASQMAAVLIFVCIPTLILIVIFMVVIYGAQIVLIVGVIVGPAMICWAPWEKSDWLAVNWIKFMLVSGGTYVIAFILANLCTVGITQVVPVIAGDMNQKNYAEAFDAVMTACVALGATILFMAWMLMRAHDLAQGLISGGGTDSGGIVAAMVMKGIGKSMMSMARTMTKSNADRGDKGNKSDPQGGSSAAAPPPPPPPPPPVAPSVSPGIRGAGAGSWRRK